MSSTEQISDGFVFGHYFLEKRLAHGGMAEVYVGRDMDKPKGDPPCVVKRIKPDLATDPQFLGMFINEAQLAAQMNHPNIVKVLDFGEHDGLVYMAMEHVDGLDCWRFARRAYPFGKNHKAIAIFILQELLEGLAHAHAMTDVNGKALNVVHRDLSPSNIYLSVAGQVKIGDFGIAQIESERYRQITYVPRGKFGYVSPEQIEGNPVDARSDLFSAGIILAELLLGEKLFKGPSQLSVLLEIRDGNYDFLSDPNDRIGPDLIEILERALATDPNDRFATAVEFRDHLTAALGLHECTPEDLATLVKEAYVKESGRYSHHPSQSPNSVIPGRSSIPGPHTKPPAITDSAPEWETIDSEFDLEMATPVMTNLESKDEEWIYTVKYPDGYLKGPMSFADIIELMCQDEILPETEVSLNRGPFKPVDQYPELARHIPVLTPTLEVSDVNNPDRRGVLTVESPAEVILSLALAGETGLLVCRADTQRKEVFFKRGRPVYVSSNAPSELLGEYLVSKGMIDRAELDMALSVLPKFDGHMGDTVIALGMISAVDLFRAIGEQIKDRLKDLVMWHQGTYDFFRELSARKDAPEIPIDPFSFICHELVSISTQSIRTDVLEALEDGVITQTPAAQELLRRITLPAEMDAFIRDLLEPTKVRDLIAHLKNDNSKRILASTMYVALETGIWMFEGGASLPWRS